MSNGLNVYERVGELYSKSKR